MADQDKSFIVELDISERLRLLMRDYGLNVAEIASVAGVSKSTMEKYLAGPSSPRATAIASICLELGVNAHWLMFGLPDSDLRIIKSSINDVVKSLLNELKQDTSLQREFRELSYETSEWRMFCWELAQSRAAEGIKRVLSERAKANERSRNGVREVNLAITPDYTLAKRNV